MNIIKNFRNINKLVDASLFATSYKNSLDYKFAEEVRSNTPKSLLHFEFFSLIALFVFKQQNQEPSPA